MFFVKNNSGYIETKINSHEVCTVFFKICIYLFIFISFKICSFKALYQIENK